MLASTWKPRIGATLVSTGLGLLPIAAGAQSPWLDRTPRLNGQLAIAKPVLENQDETFFTTAWFLTGRWTVSENFALVGELPLANFDATPQTFAFPGGSYTYSPEGSTAIGNPYVGIETGAASAPAVVFELGLRLPLAPQDGSNALATGLLADVDRWEAWLPSTLAARIGLHVHSDARKLLWVDGRLAPIVTLTTEGSYAEAFATYGFQVRTTQPSFRAGTGISGRLFVTGPELVTPFHQLELNADFLQSTVRPGVLLRIPLTADLTDDVSAVPGITLTYVGR
ncbi:MAG: hypothetical protein ACREOU_15330 [Candidatus Eiseniibacteriota bacterium]